MNQFVKMALCGKGTAESPILLTDSPARSPVKVLPGNQFRYAWLHALGIRVCTRKKGIPGWLIPSIRLAITVEGKLG